MELPRIDCATWDRLLLEFRALPAWAFRGHSSARWALASTLERRNPEGNDAFYTEYNAVHQFKRRAHNYLDRQPTPNTDGELLALMQNFGAPTRTLDFTRSPYVAAYFAFEETPPDGSDECAIIAIEPAWFQNKLGEIALTQRRFFDLDERQILSGVAAMKNAGEPRPWPDSYYAGAILSGLAEKHALTRSENALTTFEPHRTIERMIVQQGLFLWPGRVDRTIEDLLRDLGDLSGGVRKLVVPAAERGRAHEELRLMNITRESLFPGLDGFAQSLRYIAVREDRARKSLRDAILGLERSQPRQPPDGRQT